MESVKIEWIKQKTLWDKDRNFEIISSDDNKEEKMKKNEGSLYDLWDATKRINLWIEKEKIERRGQKAYLKK